MNHPRCAPAPAGRGRAGLPGLLAGLLLGTAAWAAPLEYAPAPPDNPLKGFVPYLGERPSFPHSLEWDYTAVAQVMTGPESFDWEPFEAKLRAAAGRGHQFWSRFYLEYPGKPTGVPQYLVEAGLTMRRWTNTNTAPFPPAVDHTPDYEDPRLREMLARFIRAFGERYDGDPRLGFVGLGLLGTWGEWHNHPNSDWFASKAVQREVMDAYQRAFKRTRLVARYPAGANDSRYAANGDRPLGYHDDSFAWATCATGRKQDDWYFVPRLAQAGALGKWRTQPIGGEVRPEVWECLFAEPSCAPEGQDFAACLAATHASWLANEGVFRPSLQGEARARALAAARQLGYELHVAEATLSAAAPAIALQIENRGVAPFYYDWPLELGWLAADGRLATATVPDWKLTSVQPGQPARWTFPGPIPALGPGRHHVLLRVVNPLTNGVPLRFANVTQDAHRPGWLTLGSITLPSP